MLWLPVALLCCVLSSCRHHDMCYHHMHRITIRVEFDWRYCPEANPGGMAVFFYREGDTQAEQFDFTGMQGGEVSLRTGRYRIIAYNNDTEASLFGHLHDYDAHMAYTRQGNVLEPVLGDLAASPANGETVVVCPDDIFGCTAIEVEITEDGVSYLCIPIDEADDYIGLPVTTDEQVITLFPQDMLCHYSYEVLHVSGLERISQLCGSLSGMCPSVSMAAASKHTLPVTLPLSAEISNDGRIVGEFLTFGHHDEVENPHRMEFYVWTHDGRKLVLGHGQENFDVTGQVHSAPKPRRVHLVIDHLEIPPPALQGTGDAMPSTDDWFEVNRDLNL